ncbi:putative sporulation protein YtxC [Bacillus sp. DTU_2020_1000418_1_SI_GHA_SEK_038]|uniref:putative sporulation protein YtxC n=1 Tax=Bacillus sp. DTU_2020_1000418_1_SI_GHA_SEK_038 TaxID=3077585 RepID=UPI0028E85B1C|nr:putative sporulation protein YtxC [Bacillus sp. DTU_2020_1000418_1_SI_GHA_SEK_038]WNS74546.1 putative sporulation protein YtxC [Bacillus sp. DTU_2020_1000418_1_SI_GHA_SEK_038]
MIEITFQKTEDAKALFRYLQYYLASSALSNKNILQIEDHHIVRIHIEPQMKKDLEIIKEVFYKFIITSKQDDWFRRIMAEHYYYQDEEEQQQILGIIHSILEGNREDLSSFLDDLDMEGNIKHSINEIFHEDITFSFDSFVKFRMRPLMDQMAKYVEISIDEYKMEQEYQMFIQTLREFLIGREAKLDHIHLLIDDGIHFFNENYFEMKRGDLVRMIDRKLLINHPVYVDSVTIAPLLSIAPAIIYLYTEDKEQALVRTIQNIFEERLLISSTSDFYKNKGMLTYTADEKI